MTEIPVILDVHENVAAPLALAALLMPLHGPGEPQPEAVPAWVLMFSRPAIPPHWV